jgi:ribosome recycling factor
MDIEEVRRAAEESRLRLASMTPAECLRTAAMLREVTMPRLTTTRQRELAEELAQDFEQRAVLNRDRSRGRALREPSA